MSKLGLKPLNCLGYNPNFPSRNLKRDSHTRRKTDREKLLGALRKAGLDIRGGKTMKKLIIVTLAICFLTVASYSATFAGWDPAKAEQERKAAEETIAKFKEKDPSMERFFDNAWGYAVYPTVGTGALIVGGAHGTGLVYKNVTISASDASISSKREDCR